MCSDPVTLGGGIGITYTGRRSFGSSDAEKTPCFSQNSYQRGSTLAGSHAFGSSDIGGRESRILASVVPAFIRLPERVEQARRVAAGEAAHPTRRRGTFGLRTVACPTTYLSIR